MYKRQNDKNNNNFKMPELRNNNNEMTKSQIDKMSTKEKIDRVT